MEVTETIDVQTGKIIIDDAVIDSINNSNPTADFHVGDGGKLFVCEAIVIDDEQPTLNGNLYSAQVQEQFVNEKKWIGVPLVYDSTGVDDDHSQRAKSQVGWCWASELRKRGEVTETRVHLVIPKIPEVMPLIDRISNGLNSSLSLSMDVTEMVCPVCDVSINETGRCVKHPNEGRKILKGSAARHLAVVGNPASSAHITRTSEGVVLRTDEVLRDGGEKESVEEPERLTVEERIALEEWKAMRTAPLALCCKYARLNDPTQEMESLKERLGKFTLSELGTFCEIQKAQFKEKNPNGGKQMAQSSDEDTQTQTRSPTEWVDIHTILERKGK